MLTPGGGVTAPIPGSPIADIIPRLPAKLEPGGIVSAWCEHKSLYLNEIDPPYAQVGFRDASGVAHYCVGGFKGWWLRRRIAHRDRRLHNAEIQRRFQERREQDTGSGQSSGTAVEGSGTNNP